ncbi:hypothetical protein [Ruegeria jejuensis]|uniref:hypothetical protein n=1 Tax=Ruegeria jejuensis TaxID=3233338 RepID=UPI00355C7860
MADGCDDNTPHPLEVLPAGLEVIPRQLAGFPEIRQRLLERLVDSGNALGGWRPYSDDFGSMSLEMWAYAADILGFYDERVVNESYLGTAQRRPSLRRLVGVLGHTPIAGIAGTATLAALADGTVAVTVPMGTGVRSRSFDGNPAQVFETNAEAVIHPLLNAWSVDPFRRNPTVDSSFFVGDTSIAEGDKSKDKAGSGENRVNRLLMLTEGFGLAEAELALIEARPGHSFTEQVSRVTTTEPFAGADGKTYNRAALNPFIVIDEEVDLTHLRARRPTQQVVATLNEPVGGESALGTVGGQTRLFLDGAPAVFRAGDPIIVARDLNGDDPGYFFTRIASVVAAAVRVTSIPSETVKNTEGDPIPIEQPVIAATEMRLDPPLPAAFLDAGLASFHHGFVEAGQPTNVCRTSVTPADMAASDGVPISGTVRLPLDMPGITAQISTLSGGALVLEARFLLTDAEARGALLDGRLSVAQDGTARFEALDAAQIPHVQLQLPLTIHGNILDVSRGESVRGEVLGSGDARQPNQTFMLRKKDLTYLPGAITGSGNLQDSTLTIRVDGITWQQVPGFFGCGAQDQVYVVRHDDQQNTIITFGDGKRGARLPSGVENVIADYRYGVGAAAPPANGIRQLSGAVKGLRAVRSPVGAAMGRDPDGPEDLRISAPQTALLLGRSVSTVDFEALARNAPGVIVATANWLWIPEQFQAGVVVHYIGDADSALITQTLSDQADPTLPISVTQATPIHVNTALTVTADPAFVASDVATAVADHLMAGIFNLSHAVIGGTFWTTDIFEAVVEVPGALSVAALTFSGDETTLLPNPIGGTCVPTARYFDFSATGALTITAETARNLPPTSQKGGVA